VARFDHGERVVLERFADYHREGEPYLDGVTWELSVPPQTQRYRFERGELDVITELPGIDVYRYANDERWRDHRVWIGRPLNHFVFMNTKMAPFDNRHLRRAVAAALDPEPLASVRASVGPTQRVLPPSVPGPAQEPAMRRHDVAAALREMVLAGYAYDPLTDAGGYPDPIDYITIPDTFAQASAEVFQQQLARVGIRIRLELVAWATWLVMISEPEKVQMGWRGWGADYPDPSTFFEPILTTSAIQTAGTQNVSFFSHAELDDVVARARREPQWSRRMELYQRAEEIVRDEAPLVPVYGARALALFQPRVRGYVAHAVLPERYRDVWLDRGAP
jgi:ABC-type transport system substrate-binding protein